ncbi:hypothetical protein Leryth_024744, partial [Lithospermum erythrorhizon]
MAGNTKIFEQLATLAALSPPYAATTATHFTLTLHAAHHLLQYIVETHVHLDNEVEELHVAGKSEVAYLLESLKILWEDFTCLDISQCMLNKTILHMAASYLELDMSGCLENVLGLGKHLNCGSIFGEALVSAEESPEEEHSAFFLS